MELSILLVNFNGISCLSGCLDSIREFSPAETEVILVDNASSDGSAEMVAREYPWVQLIRSERNLGFSGGNNLAARHASGRHLLLLNMDVILLEPLAPAIRWLDAHSDYGLITIGMLDDRHIPRACTGRFPTPLRLARLRSMLVSPDAYKDCEAREVDWAQGSFLLIRSGVWQKVRGLDERYFMYCEDVDLCKRVRDGGLRCGLLPRLRYLHSGGFSAVRFPDQIAGLALYVESHMRGLQRVLCRGVLLLGCMLRVVVSQIRAAMRRDEASRIVSQACRRALSRLLPGWRHAASAGFGAGS